MDREPSAEVLHHAGVLWDYHRVPSELRPSDFILAMGNHDTRVAEHAAGLWRSGLATVLVVSGAHGKITQASWQTSEAERFAEIARSRGVPDDAILAETRATNTGENITLTRALLEERGIRPTSGVLVTVPYMHRRALAAAEKQWPEVSWTVSSQDVDFLAYPTIEVPLDRTINLMMGDLQRLKVYAEAGFQTPQAVPEVVWLSYAALKAAGYDAYLLPEP